MLETKNQALENKDVETKFVHVVENLAADILDTKVPIVLIQQRLREAEERLRQSISYHAWEESLKSSDGQESAFEDQQPLLSFVAGNQGLVCVDGNYVIGVDLPEDLMANLEGTFAGIRVYEKMQVEGGLELECSIWSDETRVSYEQIQAPDDKHDKEWLLGAIMSVKDMRLSHTWVEGRQTYLLLNSQSSDFIDGSYLQTGSANENYWGTENNTNTVSAQGKYWEITQWVQLSPTRGFVESPFWQDFRYNHLADSLEVLAKNGLEINIPPEVPEPNSSLLQREADTVNPSKEEALYYFDSVIYSLWERFTGQTELKDLHLPTFEKTKAGRILVKNENNSAVIEVLFDSKFMRLAARKSEAPDQTRDLVITLPRDIERAKNMIVCYYADDQESMKIIDNSDGGTYTASEFKFWQSFIQEIINGVNLNKVLRLETVDSKGELVDLMYERTRAQIGKALSDSYRFFSPRTGGNFSLGDPRSVYISQDDANDLTMLIAGDQSDKETSSQFFSVLLGKHRILVTRKQILAEGEKPEKQSSPNFIIEALAPPPINILRDGQLTRARHLRDSSTPDRGPNLVVVDHNHVESLVEEIQECVGVAMRELA